MPTERYRDARGRWARREVAATGTGFFRELFEGGKRVSREEVEQPAPRVAVPNWNENQTPGGAIVWSTQNYDADGKPVGEIFTLDEQALQNAEMPWNAREYRVIFAIDNRDPRYPRGFYTAGPFFGEWPPRASMGGKPGTRGIVAIRFRS